MSSIIKEIPSLHPSKLTIFGDWFDTDTRTIMSLIKLGKIPHELTLVDMLQGKHKSKSFLSINPLGSLPFIIHNNFVVIGSTSVFLRYFANLSNQLKEHYPKVE